MRDFAFKAIFLRSKPFCIFKMLDKDTNIFSNKAP